MHLSLLKISHKSLHNSSDYTLYYYTLKHYYKVRYNVKKNPVNLVIFGNISRGTKFKKKNLRVLK